MWPFKKTVERTPWDDLTDYLMSDDVKFDFDQCNQYLYTMFYNGKTITLRITHEDFCDCGFDTIYTLYFKEVSLNPYLKVSAEKIGRRLYHTLEKAVRKNNEDLLMCDLFNKC